tara:strand:- start:23 stop:706 length:684 start_codon:yes stop_codon:yes gene_type:complete
MTEPPKSLTEQINNDVTLASCKKTLIILSSILLALTFSGAKITEANTFIFKITFTNPIGLSSLMLLAIGYLLIRYNSLSHLYVESFQKQWSEKVVNNSFYRNFDHHNDVVSGFIPDLFKPYVDLNNERIKTESHDFVEYDLKTQLFFNAYFYLTIHDESGPSEPVKIYLFSSKSKFKLKYLAAISLISYYWLIEQFRRREFLELYSPMFIGFIAVFCSVWSRFNPSI